MLKSLIELGDPRPQKFQLDTIIKLIYFCPIDGEYLYIPAGMHKTILHVLYNNKRHPRVRKMYNQL